jgi:RHS repeat-associated protein
VRCQPMVKLPLCFGQEQGRLRDVGNCIDENGLLYLRSRYMNPATGTFLTQSMSDGALGRVNAHNGYAYAEGNPANFVSPSGRSMVATGHAVCCWHPVSDPDAFAKALIGFGVATAVAFATMGLGYVLAPAALGVAPTAFSATVYGGAWIGLSGIAAGQAAIATGNVLDGRAIGEGLFRPDDIMRDASLAIATTAFFSGVTGVNQFTSWLPKGNVQASGRAAPSGGKCSFTEDTPVATEQGEKAISELAVGEKVLAYNEKTGETGSYAITAVLKHDDPVIVHLALDGEYIDTTPEHPFYTQERGWVAAGNLKVGEHIRRVDGSYGVVEKVEYEQRHQLMYNLTVDEAHTFFVGDGQWLVHNECMDFSDIDPNNWPKYDDLLDPNHPTNPANGQARDAGHLYGEIKKGGTGHAISAHGEWKAEYGEFTVPEGTTIRSWFGNNFELDPEYALLIEGGQYTTAWRRVYGSGMSVSPEMFGPGSKIRNFRLTTWEGISFENSITIDDAVHLKDIIGPHMGCMDLSFCTVNFSEFRSSRR